MAELTNIRVPGIDEAARRRAAERVELLLMPRRALGKLLELGEKVAGITGWDAMELEKKAVVVMAGDHGVTAEGVSAYPSEVTGQMVRGFAAGVAAINVLCRHAGIEVRVVDMGCAADLSDLVAKGVLIDAKVGPGTRNMRRGPAMTRGDAVLCIQRGAEMARQMARSGVRMLGTGDMGIGNTTPSTAIAAAVTGATVAEIVGRGTGVDDEGLARKVAVIEESMAVNRPSRTDPVGMLAGIGGYRDRGHRRAGSRSRGEQDPGRHRRSHLHGRSSHRVAPGAPSLRLHFRRAPLRREGAGGAPCDHGAGADPRPGHAPWRRHGLRARHADHRGRGKGDPADGHVRGGRSERGMIHAFFSALAFLTVIPVPEALKSRRDNAMFAGYPAAGFLIGCLLSLLFFLAGLVFSDPLAAIVLVAGSLALTGAIHLDGLADCADAFYGKRDRESTLRILKDPRIGTMGGAAIGLSLLARFAAISSLASPVVLLAMPIMCAFSRTTVLPALRLLPYSRSSGGIIEGAPRSATQLIAAAAVVMASAVLLPFPTAAALLVLAGFWRLSWKRIGGCTGDVLGAGIEIAEIVFLAALAALAHTRVSMGVFFPLAAIIFPNAALGS